jgi:hypothetical protein
MAQSTEIMRPFQTKRIDGTPRYRPPKGVKSAAQNSRRGNGRRPRGMDGRSLEGRRLTELVEAYTAGIEPLDEPTMAIARGAALMSLKLERFEERTTRGEDIDTDRLQRLSNALNRAILALSRLKQAQTAQATEQPTLAQHVAALAARKAERHSSDPPLQ